MTTLDLINKLHKLNKKITDDLYRVIDFLNSRNWVNRYIHSEGFKLRFDMLKLQHPELNFLMNYKPLTKNLKLDDNYNNANYSQYYDRMTYGDLSIMKKYGSVMPHEFGHNVEEVLFVTDKDGNRILYSSLYPSLNNNNIFRKYNKYFNGYNLYKLPKKDYYDMVKNVGYVKYDDEGNKEKLHNAYYTENYADEILFRKTLLDAGIYDSFKKDNKFEKSHLDLLDKYLNEVRDTKNLYNTIRYRNNFDDDDIIYNMNTHAYNNSTSNLLGDINPYLYT